MVTNERITVDGNEAVASVAHRLSETIAIYPITPSSGMAELSDEWSARGDLNVFGAVPRVVQLQSEAGVAGTVHGALQTGSLVTTFTASQGLLLMVPNFFKIAGELLPFVAHVAARTVATHGLSIFGDHSDVMACRSTGFALLCSGSPQEAHDLACVSHAVTLRSRVPVMHFFDGFRTSHEVQKIDLLSNEQLRAMVDDEAISAHRARGLSPDHPLIRGTAQNPDTFFQAREACNPFYAACPGIVKEELARFEKITGRRYQLFDYVGHPDAERVIVMMGSGAEVTHETVEWLQEKGERVGVLKVRLFRPWSNEDFLRALPKSVKSIAVLDRTKEPGALGEPLYQEVVVALAEANGPKPKVVGGRYGLSSKEFDPAMVRAVFDELKSPTPKNHFTIGIVDDVSGTSLHWERGFDLEFPARTQAIFWGLGADGTVGANKNSIKIIGEQTPSAAQGYFVYDSKKSGSYTTSHLRFGPGPIRSSYLIKRANFVACHQFNFLERLDVLEHAAPGATFLLNAPYPPDVVWNKLPVEVQQTILVRRLRLFVIDAVKVAREAGMGGRINSVMQTCFFALSGVLPREEAVAFIKKAIEKTYAKKGAEVVRRNFAAVDQTLENLHPVTVGPAADSPIHRAPPVPAAAPDFVQRVTAKMIANQGDLLPVSAFPIDGSWPSATTQWEKRNIALEIPAWDEKLCIQCNKCALVCPHAAIRTKSYPTGAAAEAPAGFKQLPFKSSDVKGFSYSVQVAPEDCTGCGLCVEVCPAKDKSNPRHKSLEMVAQPPLKDGQARHYEFFLGLPEADRATVRMDLKGTQLLQPLFEYSGACSGCGETPYLKLLSQLFGDRLLIANATGCSSIYGGNLPTTPWAKNKDGRGPAWANSLFEDNAEFGLGFRLGVDAAMGHAERLLKDQAGAVGDVLVGELLGADQSTEAGIAAQRRRVEALRTRLASQRGDRARELASMADWLVRKSVWIVGGDGWAYDIGFGGLDHVLSLPYDLNVLVLDTEVYSNTGGQQSKATPLGAAAKFAAAGKAVSKKDLGLMAMGYGSVFVARIAFGAKDAQTVQALLEAESYRGPSLVIAYSHCIAHGYDMVHGLEQQKRAVAAGTWPLYRFDPRRIVKGEPPLKLDSAPPKLPLRDYMRGEARFRMTEKLDPARYKQLLEWAQTSTLERYAVYEQLSKVVVPQTTHIPDESAPPEPPPES